MNREEHLIRELPALLTEMGQGEVGVASGAKRSVLKPPQHSLVVPQTGRLADWQTGRLGVRLTTRASSYTAQHRSEDVCRPLHLAGLCSYALVPTALHLPTLLCPHHYRYDVKARGREMRRRDSHSF